MCQYFRVFYTPIAITSTAADYLVTAACILHNLLRKERISYPGEETYPEGESVTLPTENMLPLARLATNASFEAFEVRNNFKEYFSSKEGSLHWQVQHVTRFE